MSDVPKPTVGPTPEQCGQLNEFLCGPEAIRTVDQDVKQLHEHIDCINKLFDKVEGPLEDFDDKYPPTSPSGALAPQWASFKKCFNEHVDESHASAVAASTLMRSYGEAVLGKVGEIDCNVEELLKQIDLCQKEVQERSLHAKGVRDKFKNLADDIRRFERSIERRLNDLSKAVPDDMRNTFNDIDTLKQKVATISREISEQQSGWLAMIAKLTPSAAKILCTISPTTTIEALRHAFGTPAIVVDGAEDAEAKLVQSAKNLSVLLEGSEIPIEIRPYYTEWWASTKEDIGSVTEKIGTISNIWHNLQIDLLELEGYLNICSKEKVAAISPFLMGKIAVSRAVWQRLTQCLDAYVR